MSVTRLGRNLPLTHTVACAIVLVVSDGAVAATLVAESIPLTGLVVLASRFVGVRADALLDTAQGSGELAHAGGVTGSGAGDSIGLEGEAAAGFSAELFAGVPHTVLVGGAAGACGVHVDTGLGALGSGGGVTAAETGLVDGTATGTLADTGGKRVLAAARSACVVDPLTFIVSEAAIAGRNLTASGLADILLGIPLAVTGIGVARGHRHVTVLAEHLTLTLVVIVNTHGVVKETGLLGGDASASRLALGSIGIPHTLGVDDAVGAYIEKRALLVASESGGVVVAVRRGVAGIWFVGR